MDAKAEKIALFRFGVIASLVVEPLPRGELTRRAQEIAGPPLRHSRFSKVPTPCFPVSKLAANLRL
jgi:hypothetical protein